MMLLILFVAVFSRLVWFHCSEHEDLPTRNREMGRMGLRGKLIDVRGRILSQSISGYQIHVDALDPRIEIGPGRISEKNKPPYDLNKLAKEAAELTGVDYTKIREAYGSKKRYILIGELTKEDEIAALKDRTKQSTNMLAGIGMNAKEMRTYVEDSRMRTILGYVDQDGIGRYGIEQQYEQYLNGSDGFIKTNVDARRREIRAYRKEHMPALPGADVHLTLDSTIQHITANALDKAVTQHKARAGTAIVQDVHTGAILAMANLPYFNSAKYAPKVLDTMSNRSIASVYEPGSVMKGVTVAVALQAGVINENTTFDVGKGIWYYGGRPIRDHVYDTIDLTTLITKSSNIASSKIGLMMSELDPSEGFNHYGQRLDLAFRSIGFGRELGIDMPGEVRGIFMTHPQWNKLTPTRIVFGQGIAVTTLQMANAYSTIANGGKLMRPYIVNHVIAHDGTMLKTNSPKILGRPLRKEVSSCMIRMLSKVTERGGTATRAATKDYTVAGKTGTGQIPTPQGGYSQTDYCATFCGFFPATAPRYTIMISIEGPQPIHYGGLVAAPVFAEIATQMGRYLSIPADKEQKQE